MQTLQEFLKANAQYIDANGNILSPEMGGNYEGSGQNAVDWYSRNIGQQYLARPFEGETAGQGVTLPYRDSLSAAWQPGREDRGGWLMDNLAKWEEPAKFALGSAALYGGINALGNAVAPSAAPAASSLAEPAVGAALDQTAAETARLAAMNAGTNTLGGIGASTLYGAGLGGAAATALPELLKNATGASTLSSAAQFLKDNPTLTQLGGALLGAAASGDKTNTQTSTKDPWAPAQQYLQDNLKTNAAMQKYYAANPFSAEQKAAYQGLLDTNANNKANVPGLLANASAFQQSKGGVMPAMTGLLTGTKANPIDWEKYTASGRGY